MKGRKIFMVAGYRKSLNIGEHYSYSENLTQFFFFSGEQKKIFHRGRIIQLSTFLLFFHQGILPQNFWSLLYVREWGSLSLSLFWSKKENQFCKHFVLTLSCDVISILEVEVFDPLCILHPPVTWIRVQCNKGKWDFHFLNFTCSRSIHEKRFQLSLYVLFCPSLRHIVSTHWIQKMI